MNRYITEFFFPKHGDGVSYYLFAMSRLDAKRWLKAGQYIAVEQVDECYPGDEVLVANKQSGSAIWLWKRVK